MPALVHVKAALAEVAEVLSSGPRSVTSLVPPPAAADEQSPEDSTTLAASWPAARLSPLPPLKVMVMEVPVVMVPEGADQAEGYAVGVPLGAALGVPVGVR